MLPALKQSERDAHHWFWDEDDGGVSDIFPAAIALPTASKLRQFGTGAPAVSKYAELFMNPVLAPDTLSTK